MAADPFELNLRHLRALLAIAERAASLRLLKASASPTRIDAGPRQAGTTVWLFNV
jgi:hypothetical protein